MHGIFHTIAYLKVSNQTCAVQSYLDYSKLMAADNWVRLSPHCNSLEQIQAKFVLNCVINDQPRIDLS
jgi:hypothetical protein